MTGGANGPATSVVDLVRPRVKALQAYVPAGFADGATRLNANENPWPPAVPDGALEGVELNRYPKARPDALAHRLADIYGTRVSEIIVTRGSTEAIDLLIRSVCEPERDGIVICPPTFGMYEVYAQLQGAEIRRIPLKKDEDYSVDESAIIQGWRDTDKLLFLCSPNNPTGGRIPTAQLARICEGLSGRAIVVIDAAYIEFAAADPTLELLRAFDNVCVLRTLSKAWGLASVRCGALLGNAGLLDLVGRAQPPYAFPALCDLAVSAALDAADSGIAPRALEITAERQRFMPRLGALRCVKRTWPSEANFILAEVSDARAAMEQAASTGLLIRHFANEAGLENCLRVTVGTPAENDRLLTALENL
jgi:histidinol-phosphate aminotransferase